MSVRGRNLSTNNEKPDDFVIGDGNVITHKQEKKKMDEKDLKSKLDLFDIIDAPLPISGEGDYLTLAIDNFEKALESNMKVSGDNAFALQSVPKDIGGLPYDVLTLIYRTASNRAILYPFIIADSMEKEYTHTAYFSSSQKEYVVTPDSIYDQNVYDRIKRVISKTYVGFKFDHVGFLLIPRGFNYENKMGVKKLLNNSMNAINTVLKNCVISATHLAKAGLISKIVFAKDQVPTIHGRTVRSDLSITVEATKYKKRENNYKDLATSEDFIDINQSLIRCDGFIDLVFTPKISWSGHEEGQSKYSPRFIITNMEQKQRTNTMGLTLTALASTFMLQMNKNWLLGLKRSRGKALVNEWHDIGAVSYEVNTSDNPLEHDFSKKIITNDPSFDKAALKKLASKIFNSSFLVSLDVEMGGPQIWLQTHFSRAAYTTDDHPDSATLADRSKRHIINVANEITDGAFDELTGGKDIEVVFPGYEKIHLGTYEDENGELRDIRDICYRAILNSCTGRDLSYITSWTNSFDKTKSTEGCRIAIREDLIRRMTSGRVKFEAMAKRITFNPFFIQFLCMALMKKGVKPMPIISEGMSRDDDRYFANYARFGNDIDPVKMMILKQRGIDLDNLSNLKTQDLMILKALNIDPFERKMEALMSRFGHRSNLDIGKGYSCF